MSVNQFTKKALDARGDPAKFKAFVEENENFILEAASKASNGAPCTKDSVEYKTARNAFIGALMAFKESDGSFRRYAGRNIRKEIRKIHTAAKISEPKPQDAQAMEQAEPGEGRETLPSDAEKPKAEEKKTAESQDLNRPEPSPKSADAGGSLQTLRHPSSPDTEHPDKEAVRKKRQDRRSAKNKRERLSEMPRRRQAVAKNEDTASERQKSAFDNAKEKTQEKENEGSDLTWLDASHSDTEAEKPADEKRISSVSRKFTKDGGSANAAAKEKPAEAPNGLEEGGKTYISWDKEHTKEQGKGKRTRILGVLGILACVIIGAVIGVRSGQKSGQVKESMETTVAEAESTAAAEEAAQSEESMTEESAEAETTETLEESSQAESADENAEDATQTTVMSTYTGKAESQTEAPTTAAEPQTAAPETQPETTVRVTETTAAKAETKRNTAQETTAAQRKVQETKAPETTAAPTAAASTQQTEPADTSGIYSNGSIPVVIDNEAVNTDPPEMSINGGTGNTNTPDTGTGITPPWGK